MSEIEILLSLLTDTDQVRFITYLQKRNKRSDTKNIQLFKDFQKGQPERLKTAIGGNAYNVLKKRLTDRLTEFVSGAIILQEQTSRIEIMKRLVLSRKLLRLKHYKIAFKQLKKAELTAIELTDYHLLNEIYATYIQHSYHQLSPDQGLLIERYNANKIAYNNEANLTIAYALIRKTFQEHNQLSEPIDFDHLISTHYSSLGISDAIGYTFQSLTQLAEIADITGTHKRNYFEIDLFFEKHIQRLQGSPIDNERQLTYHINLLYLVAHIYFRKKNFDKSITYLNNMKIQMKRYNGRYFDVFNPKYINLLALNYNFTGNAELAGQLLDELFMNANHLQLNKPVFLQAQMARIVIHFQQTEFQSAKQIMARFRQQDSWYIQHIGLEWLLNKKIIEILLQIELGNTDYVDSLINSLNRKKVNFFKGTNLLALPFLKMIQLYHQNPANLKTEAFKAELETTFIWKPTEQEDLFFMSFYAWLKSKMVQQPLYKVTLELLQK